MNLLTTEKIVEVISVGTNANISIRTDKASPYSALKIWFTDLSERKGPTALMDVTGKRFRLKITMGKFSGSTIRSIKKADKTSVKIAQNLVNYAGQLSDIKMSEIITHGLEKFDSSFKIVAQCEIETSTQTFEQAVIQVTENVTVPLLAAMAELVGFKKIPLSELDGEKEGHLSEALVKRRERSIRNRIICFEIHGKTCFVCKENPLSKYNQLGDFLEIHHLEPLSLLSKPKKFDPREDLIPLCPNCHRAIHKRKPSPYSPIELQEIMGISRD